MFGSMCECARDAHTTHKNTHTLKEIAEKKNSTKLYVCWASAGLCFLYFILYDATLIKIEGILALTPFLRFVFLLGYCCSIVCALVLGCLIWASLVCSLLLLFLLLDARVVAAVCVSCAGQSSRRPTTVAFQLGSSPFIICHISSRRRGHGSRRSRI